MQNNYRKIEEIKQCMKENNGVIQIGDMGVDESTIKRKVINIIDNNGDIVKTKVWSGKFLNSDLWGIIINEDDVSTISNISVNFTEYKNFKNVLNFLGF
ncbi:TPA: hypothetical protein ACJHHF_001878 [Staphylococcus pseudintermedius]|uniref:hypothetical protein n=1 Tax=Staphylococcus pseudintermedius TaxID=283734 RepID=UPI002569D318|nr:hypothetical protein [Staphylococcus pseudintermedius]EJO7204229.1 hypothetical protein [Staphylococcus pseudintermedius]MDK3675421.1 hypothetical protein [Staphylococcus pseudintermedius]HCG2148671.1 hypothetical protein [Staphylococcus pseudintermedius]